MKGFIELNEISNFHCLLFKTSIINYKNSSYFLLHLFFPFSRKICCFKKGCDIVSFVTFLFCLVEGWSYDVEPRKKG